MSAARFTLWARVDGGPSVKVTEGTMRHVRGEAVTYRPLPRYSDLRIGREGAPSVESVPAGEFR